MIDNQLVVVNENRELNDAKFPFLWNHGTQWTAVTFTLTSMADTYSCFFFQIFPTVSFWRSNIIEFERSINAEGICLDHLSVCLS